MTTYFLRFSKFSISIVLTILLIACGSSEPKPSAPAMTKAEDYLQAAQTSSGSERIDYLLKACGSFLQRGETKPCDAILTTLSTTPLDPRQLARYSQYRSEWHLKRKEATKALAVLDSTQLENISASLPVEQQLALLELKATANDQLGQYMNSVQLRLFIHSMLPANRRAKNSDALWSSLMKLDRNDLDRYRQLGNVNSDLNAWLELALLAKDPQSDLDNTLAKLDAWKQRWPQHPANQNLPKDLAQLKQFSANRPQQLALLVPLSGKLANYGLAISQGFMAAHYEAGAAGNSQPRIRIYDTETHNGKITALYQRAVNDGAQLVIGPLDKAQTTELLQSSLTVPVLALNQSETQTAAKNAYQFGLSPDDEVRAVVQRALAEQRHNALILAPQGEGMERIADLFRSQWRNNGGTIIEEVRYDSDMQGYAFAIRRALNIQQSQNRAKQLARVIGSDVHFTPRHRQDIDMIFIIAKPAQARAIMPMLAYQYGGDLPVYAISSVFSGATNPRLDQDINQLHFPELPWILNDSVLKQSLAKTDAASLQLPRMYALGIDSYRLHSRLDLMNAIPGSTFYGTTGALTLDTERQIQRELPMAIIQKGKPVRAALITAADQEKISPESQGRDSYEQNQSMAQPTEASNNQPATIPASE
jgi:outer membrane PBP1 activator LpoA protein